MLQPTQKDKTDSNGSSCGGCDLRYGSNHCCGIQSRRLAIPGWLFETIFSIWSSNSFALIRQMRSAYKGRALFMGMVAEALRDNGRIFARLTSTSRTACATGVNYRERPFAWWWRCNYCRGNCPRPPLDHGWVELTICFRHIPSKERIG